MTAMALIALSPTASTVISHNGTNDLKNPTKVISIPHFVYPDKSSTCIYSKEEEKVIES